MKNLQVGRWTMAVMVALGLMLLSNGANARSHGPGCGGGGGYGAGGSFRGLEHQLEGLDLEAGKRDAIYELLDGTRKEMRASRSEIKAAHETMRDLLAKDEPDVDAVMAQADAIGALKTKAKKAKLRTMIAIRKKLTSEQWATLQEHKKGKSQCGKH